jgi:hypothetical protein
VESEKATSKWRPRTKVFALLTSTVLLAHGASGQIGSRAASCDRACLEGFVDRFLDAFIQHDPARLPLASDVKFTENGQRLALGDGSWRSMVGKGTYRLFVTDPPAGQVAFIGTLREENTMIKEGALVLLALRLKVDNRQISEIETFIVRSERAAQNVEKLGTPHRLFREPIPPSERMSREDLVKTANMYFSGLQLNDGKGVYPFTDDCDRFENGSQTTNVPTPAGQTRPDPRTATNYSAQWGCREQFESGLIHFVTRIRDRRFVAVDQERGLVFSFAFFDHAAGSTRTFQTANGRTVTAGPTTPWTWELAEMFRIEKGKIRRIEAILERAPYGMASGWSTWEDAMSDRIHAVALR